MRGEAAAQQQVGEFLFYRRNTVLPSGQTHLLRDCPSRYQGDSWLSPRVYSMDELNCFNTTLYDSYASTHSSSRNRGAKHGSGHNGGSRGRECQGAASLEQRNDIKNYENSPQSAARLEMFRTETLVALLPEEKEKEPESRKDGVEKEMDDILEGGLGLSPGLEMMVVEDLPSMNSRAGLYVFLNSLVSRCGL